MPLVYRLFYVVPATGLAAQTQAVSCDLPPTWIPKSLYNPTYRDLSGATSASTIPIGNLAVKVNLQQSQPTPPPQVVLPPQNGNPAITATGTLSQVTIAAVATSFPDDITHMDERQSPAHLENFLVFTDSLGTLCGEFDGEIYRSWNNTGLPGSAPATAAGSPH